MMGEFVGLVSVVMVFGIPITAIWTAHQRKMLEMKLQMQNQGDAGLRSEVESLRREIRDLRDTSTQFDLSFDAALHRMEGRVENLERKNYVTTSATQDEAVIQRLGR